MSKKLKHFQLHDRAQKFLSFPTGGGIFTKYLLNVFNIGILQQPLAENPPK